MKTRDFAGLAFSAGLLFAASASRAAPSELQQYLDRAHAQADQTLAAASVPLTGPVTVRAYVGGDGRLNNLHVVRSSGSRDTEETAISLSETARAVMAASTVRSPAAEMVFSTGA